MHAEFNFLHFTILLTPFPYFFNKFKIGEIPSYNELDIWYFINFIFYQIRYFINYSHCEAPKKKKKSDSKVSN